MHKCLHLHFCYFYMPLVLWCCWLGGRNGIRPVKKWGAGMVVCLEQGADLHMAQLMPLPLTVSCFSKIQIAFTFLVPAHMGSPGKRAVKRVCVCVTFIFPIFYRTSWKCWNVNITWWSRLSPEQLMWQVEECLEWRQIVLGVANTRTEDS